MPEEEYISLLHSSINAISNDIDPFWFVKYGFKTASSGLKKIFIATSSPAFKWSLGEKQIETRNISKSPPPPLHIPNRPPSTTPLLSVRPSTHPSQCVTCATRLHANKSCAEATEARTDEEKRPNRAPGSRSDASFVSLFFSPSTQ